MKTPIKNLKSSPLINVTGLASAIFPQATTRKDARNLLESRTNITMEELEILEPHLKALHIETGRLLQELEAYRALKNPVEDQTWFRNSGAYEQKELGINVKDDETKNVFFIEFDHTGRNDTPIGFRSKTRWLGIDQDDAMEDFKKSFPNAFIYTIYPVYE